MIKSLLLALSLGLFSIGGASAAVVGPTQAPNFPNCATGSIINYNNVTGVFSCNSISGQAITWTATQTFAQIAGYTAKIASQSGQTYTILPADCGTRILFSSNTPVTVTLPNSSAVGCQVNLAQYGTGKVSVVAASGATVNSPHSYTGTFGLYASISVAVDQNASGTTAVWNLLGDGS